MRLITSLESSQILSLLKIEWVPIVPATSFREIERELWKEKMTALFQQGAIAGSFENGTWHDWKIPHLESYSADSWLKAALNMWDNDADPLGLALGWFRCQSCAEAGSSFQAEYIITKLAFDLLYPDPYGDYITIHNINELLKYDFVTTHSAFRLNFILQIVDRLLQNGMNPHRSALSSFKVEDVHTYITSCWTKQKGETTLIEDICSFSQDKPT